jgi:hypothetical protein
MPLIHPEVDGKPADRRGSDPLADTAHQPAAREAAQPLDLLFRGRVEFRCMQAQDLLQGDERTRGVTAARKVAARILSAEVVWSTGRIARALRKDHRTVREMLGK